MTYSRAPVLTYYTYLLTYLPFYLKGFPDNSWVVRAGALHDRDTLLDMSGFEQVSK